MILDMSTIQRSLNAKFGARAARFPERFGPLIPSPASAGDPTRIVQSVEERLGETLPSSFTGFITLWNLGYLEIASTVFCHRGDYLMCLLDYNICPSGLRWWDDRSTESRPQGLLMIAQGDPHVLVLNVGTGSIEAFVSDEGSMTSQVIASNIEQLICGLGTIEILAPDAEDIDTFVDELMKDFDSTVFREYWLELATDFSK